MGRRRKPRGKNAAKGSRVGNHNRILSVCNEIAEQFTHRDEVRYDDMMDLIRERYGSEPPSIPEVLRLCVRHDRTPPPVVRSGLFWEFLQEVLDSQVSTKTTFFSKWLVPHEKTGELEEWKTNEFTKKSYAFIFFSDSWVRAWSHFAKKPVRQKYKPLPYALGTYIGAWADYEQEMEKRKNNN